MAHVPLNEFAASHPGLDQQLDDDNRRFVEFHQDRGEGCIIEARLAVEAVVRYPRACRVLLECAPNVCAVRRAPILGVSVSEALRINTERNAGDIERYRQLYGIPDICAPERYSLIINTTYTEVDEICDIILRYVDLS
jgi:cytidylate kinase